MGPSDGRFQPMRFLPRIVLTLDVAMRRFDPTVWSARRVSSGNRRASGRFFFRPAKIRADLGPAVAASPAFEQRLNI